MFLGESFNLRPSCTTTPKQSTSKACTWGKKVKAELREAYAAGLTLRISACFRHYAQSALRSRSWMPQDNTLVECNVVRSSSSSSSSSKW
jgi:hypothetical protein